MDFSVFIGRLHPLIVHFPIALLLVAAAIELFRWKKPNPSNAAILCLVVGAATSILAAILGFVNAASEPNSSDSLSMHRFLGTAVTIVSIGIALIALRLRAEGGWLSLYRGGAILCALLVGVTGHYGAKMVYGADYWTFETPKPENEDAQAILKQSCFSCHGPEVQKGQLRLDVPHPGGVSGPAIVGGQSDRSLLIQRILGQGGHERMPLKAPPLSETQIAVLRRWIDQMAAGPAPEQKHWAYIKPVSKPGDSIDSLVRARLEKEGLALSSEAPRETLLRRVFLDLTGLPPTLKDLDSTETYEQIVDRLLASPAYGERWARPWLDWARYADTNGMEKDRRRVMWKYRDWVINALNKDMSFKQFTIEQIAGDMLPNATIDQQIASGFHRNTLFNEEDGVDAEESYWESLVDRVNTTATVWLGTTLACAQCHNHKYDPFTQKDYYQFMAFFGNSEYQVVLTDKFLDAHRAIEPTLDVPSPEQQAKRQEIQNEIQALETTLKTQNIDAEFAEWKDSIKNAPQWRPVEKDVTDLPHITGVRLELEPGQGMLNSFRLECAPAGDPERVESVDLAKVEDNILIPARPFGFDLGTLVKVKAKGTRKFRVWVTSSPNPEIGATVPIPVLAGGNQEGYFRSIAPSLQSARLRLIRRRSNLTQLKPDTALVMREKPSTGRPSATFRIRGGFTNPGEKLYAAVPQALHPLPESQMPNRLGLAHWLVDETNPLTARVIMNRIWELYFGRGIVDTTEDFGTQGERPSHLELLDYLATEFMKRGWSLKAMHKLIVTSATYQQSSRTTPRLLERDPYNRLFTRGPRFRMEGEMIRDVSLSASGLLVQKLGGPSVFPYQPPGIWQLPYNDDRWTTHSGPDRYRRGLYTFWRRSAPYPSLTTFDAPSREYCAVKRIRTNTPLQALTALNDPAFFEMARALGRRAREEGGLAVAFRLCVARPPKPAELERLQKFFHQQRERYAKDPEASKLVNNSEEADSELSAWIMVANVLLNLDETLTKE